MGKVTKRKQSVTYTPIENHMSEIRVGLGMQMLKAANGLDIAYGTYGSFEAGYSLPSMPILNAICKLYKCLPTDIYAMRFLEYMIEQQAEWDAQAKIEAIDEAAE